jgi:hypothetical protein
MTTGDAVCDVTHMITQLMVAARITKTNEDEEVTALDIALAESVNTVST